MPSLLLDQSSGAKTQVQSLLDSQVLTFVCPFRRSIVCSCKFYLFTRCFSQILRYFNICRKSKRKI